MMDTPRKVFLFSGHMVDAPDRAEARFPQEKTPVAEQAIHAALNTMGADANDLAISSGACGGDLIFAEDCLARGIHFELRLPFDVPKFLESSVRFANHDWEQRFFWIKDHPNTSVYFMEDELGKLPPDTNPYEQCNLWMLDRALSFGPQRLHFICLWDGKGGDGPGGTKHMVESVKKRNGQVTILDTNHLFNAGE